MANNQGLFLWSKNKLKTFTLEEITDKHIGKRGTAKREIFENELQLDLRKIKQKRQIALPFLFDLNISSSPNSQLNLQLNSVYPAKLVIGMA